MIKKVIFISALLGLLVPQLALGQSEPTRPCVITATVTSIASSNDEHRLGLHALTSSTIEGDSFAPCDRLVNTDIENAILYKDDYDRVLPHVGNELHATISQGDSPVLAQAWNASTGQSQITLESFVPKSTSYVFDTVNVLYAAEFTAEPIQGGDAPAENSNWFATIASGQSPENIVTVLYGVVELQKDGEQPFSEEFIKFFGPGGSQAFLLNGTNFRYHTSTDIASDISSFFWSARKLNGTAVVKDFTPPITSVILHRSFDTDGHLTSLVISSSDDGKTHLDHFQQYPFEHDTSAGTYVAQMVTLNEFGDPTARASW